MSIFCQHPDNLYLTWWERPTVIDLMEAKGITTTRGQDGARWFRIHMELAQEYTENPVLAGKE